MIAICKRNTKRLVKGVRYEVEGLYNNNGKGTIYIKGMGGFSPSYFTDEDGKSIPNIIIPLPVRQPVNNTYINFEDLKKGDILVCVTDRYKTIINGKMYRIENLEEKTKTLQGWGNHTYTRKEQSIKFEGIKKLRFNPYKFRKLSAQELRDNSLTSVLDGEEIEIIKTTDLRKIDMVEDKNLELMKFLSKSILDESRHHLNVVEWACQKSGEKYRINEEDYKELLQMKLEDIVKLLNK